MPDRAQGKRKKREDKPGPSKRSKIGFSSADDLPWRPVEIPEGTDEFGIEEVDNVQIVYVETASGNVARFKILDDPPKAGQGTNSAQRKKSIFDDLPRHVVQPEFNCAELLPDWEKYSLHPHLLRSLYARRFISPTPIQAQAIPFALAGRDVVGVAETGSGKTLAYGLPILHHIISHPRPPSAKRRLRALVLAPTRELALQVSAHLIDCLNADEASIELPDTSGGMQDTSNDDVKNPVTSSKLPRKLPLVSIATVVGGMSAQKQRRILDRGVDVLVATPGRLWDTIQDDGDLASQIKELRFLVLDEADRMIEAGHFAELDQIIRLTLRTASNNDTEGIDETGAGAMEEQLNSEAQGTMQTLVFSATLSKDLQRNLRKRSRKKAGKFKGNEQRATTLDELLLRLDFRDPQPEVIDISPTGGVVSSLKESKIECLSADKDVYLYYFLLRHPGRSLVFLAAIDGIRRLLPLLELLGVKAWPLHSQMEQRQRLKNLDRFKATSNSVLLATDIAARGLDIPAVDHVLHYQIPRSADSYIHRNGRTARAMRKGFSMLMCAPDEKRVVKALLTSVGRQETDIPEMSVELFLIDKLKARVQLARQIDVAQHRAKKENHERHWMKETADAMEVELDSDFMSDSEPAKRSQKQKKAKNVETAALKIKLKDLLAQPLVAPGVSMNYIASGSNPIVDDLIAGEYREGFLGLKKFDADSQLSSARHQRATKLGTTYEEWHGIGL